jgi:pyruvate ferredoxin oxidoreductase beta subunit/2-oxoisovalerate ferredoxin oxidoreductase beta subunit
MKFDIPKEELLGSGHLACPGCGATQSMRYTLKALGEKTIIVLPACCWSIIAGPFPYSSLQVPLYHTAFETAGAAASGIKAGLEIQGDTETQVLAWAGDGGTFDIGIQALSGAAERNDDIIYICYDNEAYMNTGIQRSSATPWGAWTTTTPVRHFKNRPKKDIMMIMAAHQIPYAATASVAFPDDLVAKVKKAKHIKGTRFLHIYSPCPPGWKIPSEIAIRLARLAVETKIFPLYEIENGERYRMNRIPKGTPVEEYLKLQGRFKHLTKHHMNTIQKNVDKEWERLLKKAENNT